MIYESSLKHHGVMGMHWGVRRYQPYPAGHQGGKEVGEAAKKSRVVKKYQNPDGSLNARGQARLEREKIKNERRKNKDKLSERGLNDPERWVTDDLERGRDIAEAGSRIIRTAQEIERSTAPKKKRMDLSKMSDEDLRKRINRELTERQYNDLFNTEQEKVSKGREYAREILDVTGDVMRVGASALAIAASIHALKS